MIWTLEIPGWSPAPLNKLMGHWGTRSKAKKRDRDVIGTAVVAFDVQGTDCIKRRIDLTVIWPKGQRSCDPDALWKTTLDGLVHAGALANDSARFCELGKVRYAKSADDYACTFITVSEV